MTWFRDIGEGTNPSGGEAMAASDPGALSALEAPRLLLVGLKAWTRSVMAVAIVIVFFMLSVAPYWVSEFSGPVSEPPASIGDPLEAFAPTGGSIPMQLLWRLEGALLSAPTIRPVFGPAPLPRAPNPTTASVLQLASLGAWVVSLAAFPFFVLAVASGLGVREVPGERWWAAARILAARIVMLLAASLSTYAAFIVLPSALARMAVDAPDTFRVLQQGLDQGSLVVGVALFLWPMMCALPGMGLLQGLGRVARVWWRAAPTLLACLLIAWGMRLSLPLILEVAGSVGSIDWLPMAIPRSAAVALRFFIDATVLAMWIALAVRTASPAELHHGTPAAEARERPGEVAGGVP